MQVLTEKHPTEKYIEVRFREMVENIIKLRSTAKKLHILDLSEQLKEKDFYTPEELSSELTTNRVGVCIRGGRSKEGLTQKQLAEQWMSRLEPPTYADERREKL